MKELFKSKKFWTLVAAIVALLSAYFCTACAASAKVNRSGVHIDTVRVDYIIRSNNFVASCQSNPYPAIHLENSLWTGFIPSTRCFTTFTGIAFLSRIPEMKSNSFFPIRFPIDYRLHSNFLGNNKLITFTAPLWGSPVSRKIFVCKSVSGTSGDISFLTALFLPVSVVARRGGRRGSSRPRPKIKTIPLGGSHL